MYIAFFTLVHIDLLYYSDHRTYPFILLNFSIFLLLQTMLKNFLIHVSLGIYSHLNFNIFSFYIYGMYTWNAQRENVARSSFLTEKCTSCNFVHILCSTVHGYSSHFKKGLFELHFLYCTHGLRGLFFPSPCLLIPLWERGKSSPFTLHPLLYPCFWSEQNHFQSWRSLQWFLICE